MAMAPIISEKGKLKILRGQHKKGGRFKKINLSHFHFTRRRQKNRGSVPNCSKRIGMVDHEMLIKACAIAQTLINAPSAAK
jgi:hypothetical protein